jgi:hypothetical protein
MYARLAALVVMSIVSASCARSRPCSDLPATDVSSSTEPGQMKAWAACAQADPDEYAWRLFFYLNQQADPKKRGSPDPSRSGFRDSEAGKAVVWETWARSSGDDDPSGVDSEVFRRSGTDPGPWESLKPEQKTLFASLKSTAARLKTPRSSDRITDFASQESRMNRSTYETIRAHGLYSQKGYVDAASEAQTGQRASIVEFEALSKEIKAQWIHLCNKEEQNLPRCLERKKRYHWRIVERPGYPSEVVGLAALHIISKDLPKWVWIDFGHVDCEWPLDYDSWPTGSKSWECNEALDPSGVSLQDSTTLKTHGVRRETVNTKWQYYRLRGTQIDFNAPRLLQNPLLEAFAPEAKSCITCHFYASVRTDGKRSSLEMNGGTGIPNCHLMYEGRQDDASLKCPDDTKDPVFGKLKHFQTDFVWSIEVHAKPIAGQAK